MRIGKLGIINDRPAKVLSTQQLTVNTLLAQAGQDKNGAAYFNFAGANPANVANLVAGSSVVLTQPVLTRQPTVTSAGMLAYSGDYVLQGVFPNSTAIVSGASDGYTIYIWIAPIDKAIVMAGKPAFLDVLFINSSGIAVLDNSTVTRAYVALLGTMTNINDPAIASLFTTASLLTLSMRVVSTTPLRWSGEWHSSIFLGNGNVITLPTTNRNSTSNGVSVAISRIPAAPQRRATGAPVLVKSFAGLSKATTLAQHQAYYAVSKGNYGL